VVAANAELREVLDLVADGRFSHGDRDVFRPVVENLLESDPYLVLADYAAYARCQQRVADAWTNPERWTRMSILNTARGGRFSSDRAIREYCDGIWNVPPVRVTLD
jgi:starch phosphorylase